MKTRSMARASQARAPVSSVKKTNGSIKKTKTKAPQNRKPVVKQAKTLTNIQRLPDEMLIEIFTYLDMEDFPQCAKVCSRWCNLIKGSTRVWMNKNFRVNGPVNNKKIQGILAIMPQLKCLRLVSGHRFMVNITWPEATIIDPSKDIILPELFPEKLQRTRALFSTDILLLSSELIMWTQGFLKWVDAQTIRIIYVADQCDHVEIYTGKSLKLNLERQLCDNITNCTLHMKSPTSSEISSLIGTRDLPCSNVGRPALEQVIMHCLQLPEGILRNKLWKSLRPAVDLKPMQLERMTYSTICGRQNWKLYISRARESGIIDERLIEMCNYLGTTLDTLWRWTHEHDKYLKIEDYVMYSFLSHKSRG